MSKARAIVLAGNPNVGKSTVFNALTGLRQHTGNWPGKTVSAARGTCELDGEAFTIIDTPGAYPGMEAEEHGQGEAIARSLAFMSHLSVPVIAVVTGEGNSGGALALSVCNRMLMLENAVYSVLSPEGFASILWKDSSRHEEACELMKLTAADLYENGIVDEVIPEPRGGAQTDPVSVYRSIEDAIARHLTPLMKMSPKEITADRHKKFRKL